MKRKGYRKIDVESWLINEIKEFKRLHGFRLTSAALSFAMRRANVAIEASAIVGQQLHKVKRLAKAISAKREASDGKRVQ